MPSPTQFIGAELQFQYRPRIIVTAELKRFARRFCLLFKPDIFGLLRLDRLPHRVPGSPV
jgi:hypothetical protein